MKRRAPVAWAIIAVLVAACVAGGCTTIPFSDASTAPLTAEAALSARNTDSTGYTALSATRAKALAKDAKVYVTYGQSNATNAGALEHQPNGDVYMVYRGRTYPFFDPVLGGTGTGGSVWGRLGERLLANGDPGVFFATAGYGGASMQELAASPHIDHFIGELTATKAALGHIDGVLIHQGETNNRAMRGPANYRAAFDGLLARIRTVTDAPVYLSQATICGNDSDRRLLELQDRIIRETPGVLRGPNTDTLSDPSDRLDDGCHFSANGLDKFADLWVETLGAASEE